MRLNELGEGALIQRIRARFPDHAVEFIVKTTQSSLESFSEVIRRHPGGRMLVTTVDAGCVESDFVRFVEAAARRPLGAWPRVAWSGRLGARA